MLLRALDNDDADQPAPTPPTGMPAHEREAVARALKAVLRGDFTVRLDSRSDAVDPGIADLLNEVVELNERMAAELGRIRHVVGSEGRIRDRASTDGFRGEWARSLTSVNDLIADLTEPTIEVDRVLRAVARGDLDERMATEIGGRPLKGEFRRSADIVNTMVDQLNAFASEVTRRAEAEAGLARLRQVVDVMPEAILLADSRGQVYLSNAAAAEILGTVPTLVIPAPEDALTIRRLDGSPCPPTEQPLSRAVFDGEVVRGERLIVTNLETGREVPILVNSAPLRDAVGSLAGGVAVFQDITPLRDLDRQKDEFLAAISHDLKTPATIIKGRANLLQRALKTHPEDIPDLAEGLEAIDDTTAQLVRIVDELLDQTRVRMGQPFELDRGPSDLLKIARRLGREYQNISPRHSIRVDSQLSGLLGDWDEARMERVVSNLISNGVKYSPQGGEVIIRVDREEHDGELFALLSVTDQGLGIPPAEVGRVFEPYFRASNVARTVSGTGVGLTGTRQIVEQHGGTITVDSTFGKSTVFTVCLPVIREPAEAVEV